MKKKVLTLIFLVVCVFSVAAQELAVQSFILKTTDLDAKVNPVYDINGDACALVKVAIVGRDIRFSGVIVGEVENRDGEYYVYMPAGSKHVKISHPDYLPLSVEFSDYGIKLEKNLTYELRIVSPTILGAIPSIEKQFLVMNVSPADATVSIDDVPQKLDNGVLTVDLVCGKHSYSVERAMFRRVDGEFEITPEQRTEVSISLEETSGFISVTSSPIRNAEVYIDGEYEGDTPFTSKRVSEGEHTVKVISDGYYIYTKIVNVIAGKTHEVEAELRQSFSGVHLIASQSDAEIRLDGKPLGNGSWKGRIDPGKHKVEQVKDGFESTVEIIDIIKGRNETINLAEMNPYYGIVSIISNPVSAEVFIDGVRMGLTPFRTNNVTVGKHNLSLVKEGYKTVDREITVNIETPEELSLTMSQFEIGTQRTEKTVVSGTEGNVPAKRVKKDFEQGRFFVGPVVGILSGIKYGGTVGYAKRFGGFIKFKSNFKKVQPEYECTSDGKTSFGSINTSGNTARSMMNITGGLMIRVAKPLFLYLGAGYGSHKLYWEDVNGNWAEVSDFKFSGVAVTGGAMLNFGKFGFMMGTTVTDFHVSDLELGCVIWL